MRSTLLIVILLAAPLALDAQQARDVPTFEAVSIKQRITPGGGGGPKDSPDRYNRFNISLRGLVQDAYGLSSYEIVGGPDWVAGTTRFDVMAKASSVPTREQMRLMLQQMLRERFALRAHMEPREMPVYILRMARDDGRLGPKLTKTTVDCDVVECRASQIARPRPNGLTVQYKQNGVTSGDLAAWLSPYVIRTVIDRTGLSGRFDVELAFDPIGAVPGSPVDEAVPIFAALPEQLGLKLEPSRELVDVLVIDSVEMPTPD
jgi:uncharacterized protein (TIGR03435 family)